LTGSDCKIETDAGHAYDQQCGPQAHCQSAFQIEPHDYDAKSDERHRRTGVEQHPHMPEIVPHRHCHDLSVFEKSQKIEMKKVSTIRP
jgi:hypothetical protein